MFAAMILETPKTEDTDLERLSACLYDTVQFAQNGPYLSEESVEGTY